MDAWLNELKLGPRAVISLIGAGGKTSALVSLGRSLSTLGPTILTTTTKIYPPDLPLVVADELETLLARLGEVRLPAVAARGLLPGGKLLGLPPAWINRLAETYPYLVVEADGAAQKPLKAHAPYEPVLPASTSLVLILAGLSVIGRELNDLNVHRAEILARNLGVAEGTRITPWILARALADTFELAGRRLAGVPAAFVLNQADCATTKEIRNTAALLSLLGGEIYVASLKQGIFKGIKPRRLVPPVAVVLAAGASKRMGQNKLLLPLKDRPVVAVTVDRLLEAGFRPLVVTGCQAAEVRRALKNRDIDLIENPSWAEGQASSLVQGIKALPSAATGAMFCLGDQPLVPAGLLKTLAAAFLSEEPDAVYPTYRGRRGNPVLFHRRVFPRLLKVTGDRGGREVLQELTGAMAVASSCPEILLDLDTPADYQKILKILG